MLHTSHKSSIAPGGSVFDIALDDYGETWLATESGLWRGRTGNWQPLPHAMPLLHINALTCIDDMSAHSSLLFAGGAPHSIVYSYDAGTSWYTARIDSIESPITCFAPSPNFIEDRVILAGTLNDGVLRSNDGGRNWRLANFGLHDFAILAIVAAPMWHTREMAFLITDEGVYRSPNGGRAWKRVLGDITPRALAINPHFELNQTVYVADEQENLYRSTDGGKTWHSVKAINSVPVGINCLWCGPDTPTTLIAGTEDGSIYRSLDDGHTWFPIAQFSGSVLTLTERGGRLQIGLYDDGLAFSIDQGHTWQQDRSFATRDITRIVNNTDRHLLAFGPTGGLWRSEVRSNGLDTWQRISTIDAHHTLLSVAHPHCDVLYVATDNGILISTDGGIGWHNALSTSSTPFVSVISSKHEPNAVWAGTTQSDIWHSIDYGRTWHCLATIEENSVLLAFELATFYSDQTPIAITYNVKEQQIIIWRSIGGGRRWQQWLAMPRSPDAEGIPCVHLATQPRMDGLAVWVAFDNQVWNGIDQSWEYYVVEEQQVMALTCVPGTPITLVATNQQFYGCADRELWEVMGNNLLGTDMMDFCAPIVGDMIGLGRGGVVWIQSYVR